jgi:hypothetical protein
MLAFWANFGSNWFYQTAAWHNFRVRNEYCYWGLKELKMFWMVLGSCQAVIPIAWQSDSDFHLTETSYTSEWVYVILPWSEGIVPLH